MPKYMTIPERTYFYDVIAWTGTNLVDLEKFIDDRGYSSGVMLARRNDGMLLVMSDGVYIPVPVGSSLAWREAGEIFVAGDTFLDDKILVSESLKGEMEKRGHAPIKAVR